MSEELLTLRQEAASRLSVEKRPFKQPTLRLGDLGQHSPGPFGIAEKAAAPDDKPQYSLPTANPSTPEAGERAELLFSDRSEIISEFDLLHDSAASKDSQEASSDGSVEVCGVSIRKSSADELERQCSEQLTSSIVSRNYIRVHKEDTPDPFDNLVELESCLSELAVVDTPPAWLCACCVGSADPTAAEVSARLRELGVNPAEATAMGIYGVTDADRLTVRRLNDKWADVRKVVTRKNPLRIKLQTAYQMLLCRALQNKSTMDEDNLQGKLVVESCRKPLSLTARANGSSTPRDEAHSIHIKPPNVKPPRPQQSSCPAAVAVAKTGSSTASTSSRALLDVLPVVTNGQFGNNELRMAPTPTPSTPRTIMPPKTLMMTLDDEEVSLDFEGPESADSVDIAPV
ncbi:MAG: uncharacterized protein KVP18_003200 [Porospora cf. gigantea A]|uniref:uncharacterized protein n=1 Tax=Porospora cf. gigantea A TaxID=2853593 RepID=UPI0035594DE1|nr:MAG: hypothetical protein KVP18_003200 [Porospora cf. gigantea A]